MPRNGAGTYTLPEAPFVAGTAISSSAVNSDFSDIASAMTASVARDGQAAMTGPLNMGANAITNVTTGTFSGAVSAAGLSSSTTLTVVGTSTLATMNVSGPTKISNTFEATGATTFGSTVAVTGALTANGVTTLKAATVAQALTVNGQFITNAGALMDTIDVSKAADFDGLVSMNASANISGALGINSSTFGISMVQTSGVGISMNVTNVAIVFEAFFYNSTPVGNITTDGVNCFYNNVSDVRLKIPGELVEDAGDIVDAIEPRWFRWKSAPDQSPQPGFMAQQVAAEYPWAVTAGRGEVGEDGFVPWVMDAGKMMPIVIAELQSLRRRVRELGG